eukprot:SAG31_NODE_2278_length_6027_cov_1.979588_4_plen_58_part_00
MEPVFTRGDRAGSADVGHWLGSRLKRRNTDTATDGCASSTTGRSHLVGALRSIKEQQ